MEEDEDIQFFAIEAKAFERAGPSAYLSELTSADLNKKVDKSTSPEDRFLIFTDAIARKIMGERITIGQTDALTESDIETILKKTRYIVGLRFKNPTAYILGYIASKGGTEIKKKRLDIVFEKLLPRFGEDAGVKEADVIRYARYWKDSL